MKCTLINEVITEDYVRNLLRIRGVEEVDTFLNPDKSCLQAPAALKNIDKGVEVLLGTLENDNPLISLIVDCDVDGFTSSAIIYQYIKLIKPQAEIKYHLHQGKAHGLEDCIEEVLEDNSDLVILPDSSSNDYEYHERFNIPILILDHHEVEEETQFSDNAIIVNNQMSPDYKNKGLTGAGIVYQFCRALDARLQVEYAEQFIDLAALGIVGDMGSLLNVENQYIVRTGLKSINNIMFKETVLKQAYSLVGDKNMSLEDIMELLTPDKISFYVVPLYNAMIRIGLMEEKERLFLSFIDGNREVPCHKRGAAGTYERVCIESLRECTNAKAKQKKMREEIASNLEVRLYKDGSIDNKMLFVVLNDEDTFQSELNGLIAMEIVSKYHRPTLIGRKKNGFIKGSGRGMDASQLKDFKGFLNQSGLFEFVQGHANAFGYSLPEKNFLQLKDYAETQLQSYDFHENEYPVNFEVPAYSQALPLLANEIGSKEYLWGSGNPEPKIFIKGLILNRFNTSICGRNRDTLRVTDNGLTYMFFFSKDLISLYENSNYNLNLNIIGVAKLNHYMGKITPQIMVNNYEIVEEKFNF